MLIQRASADTESWLCLDPKQPRSQPAFFVQMQRPVTIVNE